MVLFVDSYEDTTISFCCLSHAHSTGVWRSIAREFTATASPERFDRSRPRAKDSCLPVTPHVLRRIKAVLDWEPYKRNNIMLWAACCLGFFAFLWSGEMTTPAINLFDPSWHTTSVDIVINDMQHPSLIQLSLKGSMTDQTRRGINPFIGRTNNELCPVAVMLTHLQ